jgi:hypothetical protein
MVHDPELAKLNAVIGPIVPNSVDSDTHGADDGTDISVYTTSQYGP